MNNSIGSYKVNIVLKDNGHLPLSTSNIFTITVKKNDNEEKIKEWEKNVSESDSFDARI